MVADGAGGMRRVDDLRFDREPWPIDFTLPSREAEHWLQYLAAEQRRRGWAGGGTTQLGSRENSGSQSIGPNNARMHLAWERGRGGPLNVRARVDGDLSVSDAQALLDKVTGDCRAGRVEAIHNRGQLQYEGLPWQGELWLSDTIRLGPPSKQYDSALLGPRIVIVDALVDGIDHAHSAEVFGAQLRELAMFMSVVLGPLIALPTQDRVWVWGPGAFPECSVQQLGYIEQRPMRGLPTRGEFAQVPLRQVARPDFSLKGIDGTVSEQWAPDDISLLWATFLDLPRDKHDQFVRAAAKWQEAMMFWRERRTLSFSLMVVACEALKPLDARYYSHNVYEVVEALIGKPKADVLRAPEFRAQEVRSGHLHAGELRADEFGIQTMTPGFSDPTFDDSVRALAHITRATIIEWLTVRGQYTMPPLAKAAERRRHKPVA